MKLKVAFLLGVVLILLMGCRNQERKNLKSDLIHEINLGTLGGVYDSIIKEPKWHFYYYCHLNLVQDSIYVKVNPDMLGGPGNTSIKGGKFPLRSNSVIKGFLEEVKDMKDGQNFTHKSLEGELYCHPMYIIQYKTGTNSKVFFFNDNNSTLEQLTQLVRKLDSHKVLKEIKTTINFNDDSLAKLLVENPKYDFEPLPPPAQKTIKFLPPIQIQKQRNLTRKKN